MQPMDNKTKPAPLPPPSGIPGGEIPTGLLRGSWGLQELWTLFRRLIKSRGADSPAPSAHKD